MKIVIGTLAAPKIAAMQEALTKTPYFAEQELEILPLKVSSGISEMPITLEETMQGARNRAENAKKQEENADFYIGMEGGTTKIEGKAYLFGTVYVLDSKGNGHFGLSNMMEVPSVFEKRIYENGEELGPILAELTGVENASKKNGAFGAWSDDTLTRKDQFVLAFLSAIPPFFNQYYQM